jgi:TonB family protein
MSPEGKNPGVPGGTPDAKPSAGSSGSANPSANTGGTNSGGATGTSSTAVSITGGSPRSGNVVSGLGGAGKIAMPSTRPLYTRAEAERANADADVQTAPPNFALLAPGAKPEAIFQRRRVYSMNVNMPNLNSATGSWILNFAEKRAATASPLANTGEVAAPSPLKKVDPKYPPTLAADHVEGEVVLYAVIRRDGSVDSIQVVRSVDPLLDANSARALAQWKFAPAERNGEAVDLEAIVHIPFHTPDLR